MDKWLIVRVFLKMAEEELLNSNEFNRIMQIFFDEDKSENSFSFYMKEMLIQKMIWKLFKANTISIVRKRTTASGNHEILFKKSVLRQTKVMKRGICAIDDKFDMQYDSRKKIREINLQKRELLKLIAQNGRLSFSKYAGELHCSKNAVTARVRDLIKKGYIKRDENKKLVVIKDWTGES